MEKESVQRSESFFVAALLAVAGGFLDAYTYLCRGGVFANAQTGNIVLLGVHLAQREWVQALHYLAPIAAFAVGVLAAEFIRARRSDQAGRLHWRHFTLGAEIVLLAGVSFVPQGDLDAVVNVLVAFVCALQVETFRKVRGYPFASTMCTGNLRSGTEALYHGVEAGDPALLKKSRCYYGVIACFIGGAALGGLLSAQFPQRATLAAAAFQAAAFAVMLRRDERRR